MSSPGGALSSRLSDGGSRVLTNRVCGLARSSAGRPIRTNDSTDLPAPSAEIRTANIALGEITAVYGAQGFALIRLDRWAEAGGADLRAGETMIRITKPEWLVTATGP